MRLFALFFNHCVEHQWLQGCRWCQDKSWYAAFPCHLYCALLFYPFWCWTIFQIATSGANEGYFTEETVLNRVPGLLLILAAIYLVMGLLGENDVWPTLIFSTKKRPKLWLPSHNVWKLSKKVSFSTLRAKRAPFLFKLNVFELSRQKSILEFAVVMQILA